MSSKATMALARNNTEHLCKHRDRLDKLEKSVKLMLKALSVLERGARTTRGGTTVPQVKLPDSLAELEIGQDPKGA
jgi:hypothetical protein